MVLPLETILALYPQPVVAGNTVLKPLTIGGWTVLAAFGIDPMKTEISPKLVLAAAAILSIGKFPELPSDYEVNAAIDRIDAGLNDAKKAVESVFNQAFITYVEAMPSPDEKPCLTPHGLGTPLELADFMMGEYSCSLREALDTPVATAFALIAATCKRHGGKLKGFDYVEREYAKKFRRGH